MMTLTIVGSEGVSATVRHGEELGQASVPLGDSELVASVQHSFELQPGESRSIDFAITWHFPNFYARGCGQAKVGHHYAVRYKLALAVADYLAESFARLTGYTCKWVDTWYDSTLPYWLLDRTMANTSTLATTTAYRFADGRFWAWEGIGCCEGTCTHVWHYAQALGRLFPEIERDTRKRVDLGIAQQQDGGIGHRAALTHAARPADDGHCGRILGAYREHLMSADGDILRQVWPNVKRALKYIIRKDADGDGMITGAQPNTLDAAWYGKVSFLASLYLAALRAGEQMAQEANDDAFARQCRSIADRGAQSIL
jgi:non-lysosomal glucosylceramidase